VAPTSSLKYKKICIKVSVSGTIAVWNRNGGSWECTVTLEGHENEVKCAVFSPSGNFLATCSRDKSGKTSSPPSKKIGIYSPPPKKKSRLSAISKLLIKSIEINENKTKYKKFLLLVFFFF